MRDAQERPAISPSTTDDPPFILVVDDDTTLLESVKDTLTLSGYEVSTALNGVEALQAMQARLPNLIVSDIMMPQMDGYQLFQAIRSNPAWTLIPFIFLTARGQKTDIQLGVRLGVDAYLVKPFEPEDLIGAVEARLKRMQEVEAAVQKDLTRTKQRLVTMLSHELRTPLTYIYGYIDLLKDGAVSLDDEELSEIVTGVHTGAERLARLVEDLLFLASVDSGLVTVTVARQRRRVELAPLIHEIVQDLSLKADSAGVTLHVQVADDLSLVCMPAYLQDAIARLVDNAIKFSVRGGGQVSITAEQYGDEAIIRVRDNGIGIDPNQQQRIFDAFEQVNREVMEQQGAGLGLPIASSLVKAHGGRIEIHSQPGQGSLFSVVLPQNLT